VEYTLAIPAGDGHWLARFALEIYAFIQRGETSP
jgi:hypothetical protein